MLCCIRRTKPVEKNEEPDQKLEQDSHKPEDKAHKAATKIQASFRGHIIRKKLKNEKKEESPSVPEAGTEGVEKNEKASPLTEPVIEPSTEDSEATNQAKSSDPEKVNNSTAAVESSPAEVVSSEPRKEVEISKTSMETTKENKESVMAEEGEKASSPIAKDDISVNECTDNAQSIMAIESKEKEELNQANVPATSDEEPICEKSKNDESESTQLQENKDDEPEQAESAQVEVNKDEDKADQDKV